MMKKNTNSGWFYRRRNVVWSFGGAFAVVFLVLSFLFCPSVDASAEDTAIGPIAPRITDGMVEFSYKATLKVKSVSIAGEFNSWNPTKDFLKYDERRGLWYILIPLDVGKYEYKFLIDGEWMDGPNLVVEVKKDKSGKLLIKKETEKFSPNTPYSGRINFSGKFLTEVGAQRSNPSEDFNGDGSYTHLDIDWKIYVSDSLKAFARLEYDSGSGGGNISGGNYLFSGSQGLMLRQSNMRFTPSSDIEVSGYYATKCIQFDDPMKILDRSVSLRYQEVEFSDEVIPAKAFGLWEQTILTKINSKAGDVDLFYSDLMPPATYFQGAGEDNFGARYKFSFETVPLAVGFTTRLTRGAWWPWANMDNNWFPDPQQIYGYSLNSSTRSLASNWYRGYVEKDFYSIDGRFEFLPGLDFWGESAIENRQLKTVRYSGDVYSDKRWQLESNTKNLAGVKYTHDKTLAVELQLGKTDGNFMPPLYSTVTYPISSDQISFALRLAPFSNQKFTFAFSLSSLVNGNLPTDVLPLDLHPYAQNLFYNNGMTPYQTSSYGGRLIHVIKEDKSIFSGINFSDDILSFSIKNKTSLLRTLNRYKSEGDILWVSPSSPSDDEWIFAETLFDGRFFLVKPLSLITSVRHFYVEDKKNPPLYSPASEVAYFAGIRYDFSSDNSAYIRLGWGLDPEGTDEDISSDFDRREMFLYNQNSSDIIADARALSDFNRLSLKAVLRF